jgi:hypothetical protein
MQALVLCRLLAQRGVETSVVIGVQPGDSFGAHAWVERDGQPLQNAGADTYSRLVAV